MKMNKLEGFEPNEDACISSCIGTCEKDIYSAGKMEAKTGVNLLERPIEHHTLTENSFTAREINLENILNRHQTQLETTTMVKEFPTGGLQPSDYLRLIESHIPEELISSQCFEEIKNLAGNFSGNLTSFFGFESRLNKSDARSDYLFAISARKGEREALVDLIESDNFTIFRNRPEWQQVAKFAMAWADPHSILHEKVLGLWFEFDSFDFSSEIPIPNIFLQTTPLRIDTPKDISKCTWITRDAFPLMTGQHLSKKMEQRILRCIQKLPKEASCIHIGVMLSRAKEGVRLVLNRIRPNQIIPYLESIGWSNDSDELSSLLKELENYVTRIVLHINIGEQIDPKIGLECSFYPDRYNLEEGWSKFFEYLAEKGLCNQEKKSALLHYSGVEQEYINEEFNMNSYMIATKIPNDVFSHALVRYISHVKIIYQPNHPLEAKAYPGVRLFGHLQ